MTYPAFGQPGETASQPVCPRHPDRVTYIRCQRCGRPVCPECQRPAAVGVQCVDCVAAARKAAPTFRTVLGGRARAGRPVVTLSIIAVCTVLYLFRLKDAPLWLVGFAFTWTGLILGQIALGLWAWWSLGQWRAPAGSAPGGDFPADPLAPARRKERRWRFRIAFAWGLVPLVLWVSFTAGLCRGDEWMIVLSIVLLHFLPLMLIDGIRYLVWQRRKDDAPVRAMRLAGIAAFMLPALFVPAAWFLGAW